MSNDTEDPFGQPIYAYTDAQALEDGVLVAISGEGRVNRVTRAVFDHFAKPIGNTAADVIDITPLTAAIRAILTLEPKDSWRTGEYQNKKLWLIPNEAGGLTLMFPEDY